MESSCVIANINANNSSGLSISETSKTDSNSFGCNQLYSQVVNCQLIKIIKVALKIFLVLPFIVEVAFTFIASRLGIGKKSQVSITDEAAREKLKTQKNAQQVDFRTEKGEKIEGMYFSDGDDRKTILLCSGSHQSFEFYTEPMINKFRSLGYNVLVFNYTGFGNSEGSISEEGVYRSSDAAYRFLVKDMQIPRANIICWGYSLGGAAATHLAAKHGIDIVLDRTFSSASRVAYSKAPKGLKNFTKFIFDIGLKFNNLKKLKKISSKVVIFSGDNDENMDRGLHHDLMGKHLKAKENIRFQIVKSTHLNNSGFWYEGEELT
jgi:alpha/beta superfamily hydrolase